MTLMLLHRWITRSTEPVYFPNAKPSHFAPHKTLPENCGSPGWVLQTWVTMVIFDAGFGTARNKSFSPCDHVMWYVKNLPFENRDGTKTKTEMLMHLSTHFKEKQHFSWQAQLNHQWKCLFFTASSRSHLNLSPDLVPGLAFFAASASCNFHSDCSGWSQLMKQSFHVILAKYGIKISTHPLCPTQNGWCTIMELERQACLTSRHHHVTSQNFRCLFFSFSFFLFGLHPSTEKFKWDQGHHETLKAWHLTNMHHLCLQVFFCFITCVPFSQPLWLFSCLPFCWNLLR